MRSAFKRAVRVARLLTFLGARDRKFRSLHVSGALLSLSGVASVALVTWLGAADVADIVALRVLAYSCWLYGGLGLYALLSPAALDPSSHQIALLRGERFAFSDLHAFGIFGRLALGMCASGLLGVVAALVVSPSPAVALHRLLLVFTCTAYLLSLSLLLSAVAAFSHRATPKSPRRMTAFFILAPFFLSLVVGGVPSIPGAYIWMFGRLIAWGGSVG